MVVSVQVCGCGCVCAGVWVWACLCLCRCVGVSVQVYGCVCIFAMCGVIQSIRISLYIALYNYHSPLHSHSLPHITSSFHVYCSSSLFIHLRLVIVHLTTQRCRDLSVSSKRWRLTALNMLRVLHTFPSHTHMHGVRYVVTCHRRVIILVLIGGGAVQ